MKTKSLYLLISVFALLFSCSDNSIEDAVDEIGSKEANAYFSLALTFPNVSGTTPKASVDGYQQGLSTEQKFQTVGVALANAENKIVNFLYYTADDFTPNGNSAIDDDNVNPDPTTGTRTYYSKASRIVTKGEAKVLVFLNPTQEIIQAVSAGKTIDPAMMVEITKLTSPDITNSYAKNDNFLMGNANPPSLTTIEGTQDNPTIVHVDVERFVAKVVENTTTPSFSVENKMGATDVTASFVAFNYNILNKRAFILKQVQQRSDNGAIAGEYIVDPNFVSSDYLSVFPKAPWYGNDFFVIGNKGVNKTFNVVPQIDYCLENTMISNEQYINKSTSIVYKAAISVNSTSGITLYTYKNVIYTSYASLATVYNADYPATPNALQALFTEQDVTNAYTSTGSSYSSLVKDLNKKLNDNNIKCYYNGECYYNWPIKHWDQNVLSGRMEFGLVRNNVYYLKVKSIYGIGTPWVPGGPEDPDTDKPSPPDESDDSYLSVAITVLPWVIRNNNIEF